MVIPYGRQTITEQDIHAVLNVLQADYLTTGPTIEAFETQFSEYVGSSYAVAVSSGTAALHAAMFAIGIGPGDEVIVPPITFAATANAVVYQGATPVFADVSPDTLLIDPFKVIKKITPKTKAIIAVDYAGQPCDYLSLRLIAEQNNLFLISDACHALGAEYRGRRTGSLADITVFSFHPVKHITTGEGGMVTTDQKSLAEKMRLFRNHGINSDHRSRQKTGTWYYEMVELGYNYRLTDLQAGRIIRDVIRPKFRDGDFDGGTLAGVTAMVAAVRGEYQAEAKAAPKAHTNHDDFFGLGIFLLFAFFGMARVAGRHPKLSALLGGILAPVVGVLFLGFQWLVLLAPIAIGLVAGLLFALIFGRMRGSSGDGWVFSSGGSSSGDSGFSDSFDGGGGDFGGGGSSGDW